MNTTPPAQPPRTLAAVAAENGLSLGAYLIVLALLSGLGAAFGPATLLVWAGSIGLPFFFYTLLRRNYAEAGFASSTVELWAQSLMSFFLAAMLQAVAVYCALRFVAPDFISSQVDTAIAAFESTGTPEGDMWASSLRNIITETGLPTPVDVTANLIVFNIFCGAVIGLVDSIVLRARYASTDRRARYTESHRRDSNN
jgi:hypothetical protein